MELNMVVLIVNFVVGVVLPPWVTEIVTKIDAPMRVKSFVNAGLSALTGAVATAAIDPGSSWQTYLAAIGVAWVASMRGYFAGIAEPAKRVNVTVGIGKPDGRHNRSWENE